MGITRTTYESILKEYEDLQLQSSHELEARKEQIYRAVPQLETIEERITSLYVKLSIHRLSGVSEDEISIRSEIASLNTQKVQLLEDAGYSTEDLLPHYSCEICKDTGYDEDGSMCSCFRSRIIDHLYDFSHIRNILEKENFNTFDYKYYSPEKAATREGRSELDMARDAVAKAMNFVRSFKTTPSNMYICGGTGVGKTFLANCIAREIIEAGYTVVYLSAVRLFDILADSTFSRADSSDISSRLIYDCDLLVIDDLGTEMTNSFVQTQLFNIINERFLKERHTVISSNLSVSQLQTVYSERVFSRIAMGYTVVKLFADDIRIQKALEV